MAATEQQSTLDTFISNPPKLPTPTYITQPIQDRDSYFQAATFKLTNPNQLQALIKFSKTNRYHQNLSNQKSPILNRPPTHNIKAWRFLSLDQTSKTSGSKDYSVQSGYDDDGERWAGRKVLNIMESHATIDALIIVSRWYGGTMLGPIRFQHIDSVSIEACKSFGLIDELSDKQLLLTRLESDIKRLREELNEMRNQKNETPPSNSADDNNQRKRKRDPSDNTGQRFDAVDQSTPTSSLPSDHPKNLSSALELIPSHNFDLVKLQNDLNQLNKLLLSKEKSLKFLQSSINSFNLSAKKETSKLIEDSN